MITKRLLTILLAALLGGLVLFVGMASATPQLRLAVLKVKTFGKLSPALVDALSNKLRAMALIEDVGTIDADHVTERLGRHSRRLRRCRSERCRLLKGRILKVRFVASGEVLRLSRELYQVNLSIADVRRREVVAHAEEVVFGNTRMLLRRFQSLSSRLFQQTFRRVLIARYLPQRFKRVPELKGLYPYWVAVDTVPSEPGSPRLTELKVPTRIYGFLLVRRQRANTTIRIGGQWIRADSGPILLPHGRHTIQFYDARTRRVKRRSVRIRQGRLHQVML